MDYPLLPAFLAAYLLLLAAECVALWRAGSENPGGRWLLWGRLRRTAAPIALIALFFQFLPGPISIGEGLLPGGIFGNGRSGVLRSFPALASVSPGRFSSDRLGSPNGSGNENVPASNGHPEVHWYIHQYSDLYGVDPLLVQSIIRVESNYQTRALSHRGAMGLMQITEETAKYLGLRDPYNIEENLEGGIRYLRMLLKRYRWNLRLALASYNAGPTTVRRFKGVPPYRETRDYVRKVIREYESLKRAAQVFRATAKKKRPARAKGLVSSLGAGAAPAEGRTSGGKATGRKAMTTATLSSGRRSGSKGDL